MIEGRGVDYSQIFDDSMAANDNSATDRNMAADARALANTREIANGSKWSYGNIIANIYALLPMTKDLPGNGS